ncbi:MAG: flagellar hook-basal body complex protein FliE, partial [Peptococcaceae bacterium]|nr:flagellar hook-basal body complex protein FliE [Peptococcaceae bacterium]
MQVTPLTQALVPAGETTSKQGTAGSGSFSEMLNNAIEKLNDTQTRADNLAMEFLTGEVQDLHQVTIAMQEAKLS